MNEASTIGLDIAKQIFHAHGADASGAPVFSRRITLANKTARIVWAVLAMGEVYQAPAAA